MASLVDGILRSAQERLRMDLVYVSELTPEEQIVRVAIGDAASFGLHTGTRIPLDETYCARVIADELPNAIPNVSTHPVTAGLSTATSGIGAYIGVPIHLRDGHIYGTLCCVSGRAEPGVGDAEVQFLEVLARLIADHLDDDPRLQFHDGAITERVRRAIDRRDFEIHFQPIVDLASGRTVGAEALARFADGGHPLTWFGEATQAGLGPDLERVTAEAALSAARDMADGIYISLNLSPAVVTDGLLDGALNERPVRDVVVEITEHAKVDDYEALREAVEPHLDRGMRLALDDAGSGFSGLRHIVELSPDIIKLDVTMSRDIGVDPVRSALAATLSRFADEIGATITAEGVENVAMLRALRALGVHHGQGYLFAKPGPLPLPEVLPLER